MKARKLPGFPAGDLEEEPCAAANREGESVPEQVPEDRVGQRGKACGGPEFAGRPELFPGMDRAAGGGQGPRIFQVKLGAADPHGRSGAGGERLGQSKAQRPVLG